MHPAQVSPGETLNSTKQLTRLRMLGGEKQEFPTGINNVQYFIVHYNNILLHKVLAVHQL